MAITQRVAVFTYFTLFLATAWANKQNEIEDNKISIRFDQVSLKEWDADMNDPTAKFKTVVANSTTSHCRNEPDCSLGTNGMSSAPFTDEDVMILPGYPADENADVQIVFYVSIVNQDKAADGNQYALKKSALEKILKENMMAIANATGYAVMFIGDERVGTPLDGTLNSIMIPVTIGFLVLLILITLCLHFQEKRQEKTRGLITGKRAEVPPNDAHGEGIVLTAVSKNSAEIHVEVGAEGKV